MRVSGYCLARWMDPEKLEIEVRELIAKGWEPLGAPFHVSVPRSGELYFIQAMIKRDRFATVEC